MGAARDTTFHPNSRPRAFLCIASKIRRSGGSKRAPQKGSSFVAGSRRSSSSSASGGGDGFIHGHPARRRSRNGAPGEWCESIARAAKNRRQATTSSTLPLLAEDSVRRVYGASFPRAFDLHARSTSCGRGARLTGACSSRVRSILIRSCRSHVTIGSPTKSARGLWAGRLCAASGVGQLPLLLRAGHAA